MARWHEIQTESGRFSDENMALIVLQGDDESLGELRFEKIDGEYRLREESCIQDKEEALRYYMSERNVEEVRDVDGEFVAGMKFEVEE